MQVLSHDEMNEVGGGPWAGLVIWIERLTDGNERAERFQEATGDNMFGSGSGNMK